MIIAFGSHAQNSGCPHIGVIGQDCPKGYGISNEELFVNGDFSAGNTGFASDYTYCNSYQCLQSEGRYAIGPDPGFFNHAYQGIDHTTGTGNFMIVHGDTTQNSLIWSQSIPLDKYVIYKYQLYVASLVLEPASPTWVTMEAAGTSTSQGTYGYPYVWEPRKFWLCMTKDTTIEFNVKLYQNTNPYIGYQFGLDDISLTKCIPCHLSISSIPDTSICRGSTIELTTFTNDSTASVSWKPALGLSSTDTLSPTASPIFSTSYIVTATATNGCKAKDTVNVTVQSNPFIHISDDTTICQGTSVHLNAIGGSVYSWAPSVGLSSSIIPNPVATPLVPTMYTVNITGYNGCQNKDSVYVGVNHTPIISTSADTSICFGDSAYLSASGGGSYQWQPATSLNCDTCPNPIATPGVTTTYTLTVTNDSSCSTSKTVEISVIPNPIVSLGPDIGICTGKNIQLNGSVSPVVGNYTFNWTPTIGLSNHQILNPIASPGNTTAYTLYATNPLGCSGSDSIIISTNLLNLSTGGAISLCRGDTTQLNVSGAGLASYSWTPPASISDPSIVNPKANPLSSTIYTVTATDSNGCTGSATQAVNVLIPSINPGNDTTICFGTQVTLTASGAVSYVWDTNNTLSCSTCYSPIASPVTTEQFYVTGIDTNGCSGRDSVKVTVLPLPSVSATAGKSVICRGSSTQLGATVGVSYTWFPPSSIDNIHIQNPVATPFSTTTYTVIAVDTNGCSNRDSVQVKVEQGPTINLSSDVDICLGDTTQLSVSGGLNQQWTPSTGLSCQGCDNPYVYPQATTTYTVIISDSKGCSDTANVTITVNPLPKAGVSEPDTVCSGQSKSLLATGGSTYQWNPSTSLSCNNCPNPIFQSIASHAYTVIVTDLNGCQDTATTAIAVIPNPVIRGGSNLSFCIGDSLQLLASGGSVYYWTPATALSCSSCNNPIATPITSTTYTVTGYNNHGCSGRDSVILVAHKKPKIILDEPPITCPGDTVQLNANGALLYSWAPVSDMSCSGCANPLAYPTGERTYTVTGLDSVGCEGTAVVKVLRHTEPLVDAGPDITIYEGQAAQLQAIGASSYIWHPTIWLDDPNAANPIALPESPITYVVTGHDKNGCKGLDSISISIIESPELHIPSAFSPNGDGRNDRFAVMYGSTTQFISFKIYNRWGNMIFSSTDPNAFWDGSFAGVPQPVGTYVYVIKVVDNLGNSTTKQGHVVLLR